MNKELIPIIAAYWGCECSYETSKLDCSDGTLFDGWEISNIAHLKDFKLHLRRLWDITEAELRELGKTIETDDSKHFGLTPKIQIHDNCKRVFVYDTGSIDIYSKGYLEIKCSGTAPFNHLRSKGFCVDQALADAGLVEWIEKPIQSLDNQARKS